MLSSGQSEIKYNFLTRQLKIGQHSTRYITRLKASGAEGTALKCLMLWGILFLPSLVRCYEIGIWAGGTRVFMKSALFRLNFYKHKTNYACKLCKNASFAAAVALTERRHRSSRRTHWSGSVHIGQHPDYCGPPKVVSNYQRHTPAHTDVSCNSGEWRQCLSRRTIMCVAT